MYEIKYLNQAKQVIKTKEFNTKQCLLDEWQNGQLKILIKEEWYRVSYRQYINDKYEIGVRPWKTD